MGFLLGYGLGGAIGLFSSSVNPNISGGPGVETRQSAKEIFKEMRSTTHGYAKNFALIGAVFSVVECTIETVSSFLVLIQFQTNFFWFFRVVELLIGRMELMLVE